MPSLSEGLAGVGGALVAAASVAAAADLWDGAGGGAAVVPFLLTAAVLVASLVVLVRSPRSNWSPERAGNQREMATRTPGKAAVPAGEAPAGVGGAPAAAAVAASGLVLPAVAFFAVASLAADFPSLKLVALVAGLGLAALYLVGPAPGRTFHLTVLAVAGWLFALSLSAQGPGLFGRGTLDDQLVRAGVASLVVGLLELSGGWWLDRYRLAGAATPLLGVGSLASGLGAALTGRRAPEVVAGLLLATTGVAVVAASSPARRGTLWAGLAVVAGGLVVLATGLVPGDDVVVTAAVVAVAGAALALVGPLLEPPGGSWAQSGRPDDHFAPKNGAGAGEPGEEEDQ